MKKKIFIAAAMLTGSIAQAQKEQVILQDSSKELSAVIITANKIEQKQNETGKVLTVISRREIEKSQGKSIGEVLNQQVGISIGGANSTLGTVQTVYTRGASSANTLILFDGIPLYDASGISSEFDLNSFALEQVERIEILKGAQGTLYGSDAVAGVINIIPKQPAGKSALFNANLAAGSYNTLRGGLSVSGKGKNGIEYFAGYNKTYSDGFSSAYDSSNHKNFDADGFKQDAILASIGFRPAEKLFLKLYGKFNLNKAQIDAGAFTDDKDYTYQTKNLTAGLALKYQFKKAWLQFNYSFNDYSRHYDNDSIDIGGYSTDPYAFYTKFIKERYKGKSHFAEVVTNVSLHKDINLVAGIDARANATSQDYFSISNYGPYASLPIGEDTANTKQWSAYASFLYNDHKGFTAGVGGRYNQHSVYGGNGTFSINPSYSFKRFKVFSNISSGYRVPSLYQLYSEFGNTNLKPEQSLSYEAGLQYTGENITSRIVGFKRDTRDVFIFYSDPVTFMSQYKNEDKQNDHGVELELLWTLNKKLNLSANYTYVNGKIHSKDITGKDTVFSNLYRQPKNVFNLSVSYMPVSKALITAHVRSTGRFYEPKFGALPVTLNGYYTLDIYCEFKFSRQLKVFADFKNITDQHYFDQEGFNTRRFNVNGGVAFNF